MLGENLLILRLGTIHRSVVATIVEKIPLTMISKKEL